MPAAGALDIDRAKRRSLPSVVESPRLKSMRSQYEQDEFEPLEHFFKRVKVHSPMIVARNRPRTITHYERRSPPPPAGWLLVHAVMKRAFVAERRRSVSFWL